MILTKKNVDDFLKELDRIMYIDYGELDYSHQLSPEEWLKYEGESIEWVIKEERYLNR